MQKSLFKHDSSGRKQNDKNVQGIIWPLILMFFQKSYGFV